MSDVRTDYVAGEARAAADVNNENMLLLSMAEALRGTGADGELSVPSGTYQLDCENQNIVIKQYTSVNIASGATVELINVPNDGVLVVFVTEGDYTNAGTINYSGGGAIGGAGVTVSRTSSGHSSSNGNNGTEAFLSLGQTRRGGAGQSAALQETGGNQSYAIGTGGGGAANSINDGTASASGSASIGSAGGGSAGTSLTDALLKLIGNTYGITLAPGAGGASAGVGVAVNLYSSGTFSATSADGGRGGASFLVVCNGNYTHSGTTNLSGIAAAASSTAQGTISGSNSRSACAAGGSSGGASGSYLALVRGTITDGGTYTVSAGASASGSELSQGAGGFADGTNGGASANGAKAVLPIL